MRAALRAAGMLTSPDKGQHLEAVASAVAAFEAARKALEDAVRGALNHGASWAEIGALLGISRQAAFQRYGPKQARLVHGDAEPQSAPT